MAITLRQKGMNDEQSAAKAQIIPGVTLYGFCCGYFGRDSYREKIVTQVHGDMVTVRELQVDGSWSYNTSRSIDDWVGLIESSNERLREIEEED